ncbi:FadR/GntR family transcriptional regulator [Corynebacterium diphtheriae]|uniref:FadR/GntR family transcriptional regulator n=1 Tax=Corynebacterium diphtheriae TaxID=1717 RepID=UPI0024BC091E|nr:GntR family transcriptional regulator [Corynebacterium diphtheriae]
MSQSTQRAYQEVLDWLEKELRKGSIAIGDKLPGERALAEQFELSRASVREAIRILTSMGLVRTGTGSGPHSGAIVISEPSAGLSWAIRMYLSARSLPLKDLVNTCILIESNAAADAATPKISPDSPERSRVLNEAHRLLDSMDDPTLPFHDYHIKDVNFHILITSLAGNLVTETIMESLRYSAIAFVIERLAMRTDWAEVSEKLQREHRNILRAIEERNPDKARTLVHDHIADFYELTSH